MAFVSPSSKLQKASCAANSGQQTRRAIRSADEQRPPISRHLEHLKAEIAARHVRVVALDDGGQCRRRVHGAHVRGHQRHAARHVRGRRPQDYDDRRRRQAQGQAKAKAEGRYKGRPEDTERNAGIARMLAFGQSWGLIIAATGCSRSTIAKIAKRAKQAA